MTNPRYISPAHRAHAACVAMRARRARRAFWHSVAMGLQFVAVAIVALPTAAAIGWLLAMSLSGSY